MGAGKGAFPTQQLESWTVMILSGERWLLSLPLALRKPQFPQNDGQRSTNRGLGPFVWYILSMGD